ncbi:hypothetical protein ACP275_14G187300 [Erythranthe tilingii]
MGRDVTGLRTGKKPNPDNGTVHVAPKASPEKPEKNEDNGGINERTEKQDALVPEEKIINAEPQKSTSPAKPASPSSPVDANSFETVKPVIEAEKQTLSANQAKGAKEENDSGVKNSPKSSEHSPKSANKSQTNSQFMPRKQLMPSCKSYYDEEDNWSMASSTATSVRSRITVPVAPRFTCTDRLERRKEFYTKLEEKHRALEKERLEYEARTKEEEQAAIKQLRKNMAYKANPVPNFYREGPPPKVELKKYPVTRAKSPNLTRRKSCGDALTRTTPEEKGSSVRAPRHSVGVYKEANTKASPPIVRKKSSPITPKSKDQNNSQKLNGSISKPKIRPQQIKETTENSYVKEQANAADIAVES